MPKTGATRYQKFLKSERAKTKLKSKELPKGTNVTKTNFKIKKIVIREQLKTHGQDVAVTRKNLNLKELLSRLNHFNVNSRTDGLSGLSELVSARSDVLELHLGQLLHGVTPLVLNVDKTVRRESLKVLHLILSKASPDKMSPFFDVVCTYLRCAMTHIDVRIQEDSLLFLDVLLLCTPQRVAADFYKIIPNFIDMISKLRVDSKPGRTLTVNLNSRQTSARWRVKVLHRLRDLLDKFVRLNRTDSRRSVVPVLRYIDAKQPKYYPLTDTNVLANCHLPCFSSKNRQNDLNVTDDEAGNFKKYLGTLLPLLFETWLEVCPNANKKYDKNTETVISEEAAALLKHLLEVVSLLWQYVHILNIIHPTSDISNWFNSRFTSAYSQHIVSAFPYNTIIRSARDHNSSVSEVYIDSVVDPKMIDENLKICHLFVHLNSNVLLKEQSTEVGTVLNYIENVFSRNKEESNGVATMKVLNSLFSTNSSLWTKNSLIDSLFDKVVSAYFNKGSSSSMHQELFALLCKISLDNKLARFHKTASYERWISNLPDILCCETISSPTIDIIHKFATQNNQIFNAIIKPKIISILKNLPFIKIIGGNDEKDCSSRLLSLLYWINGWDSHSLNFLESQLRDNAYGNERSKFIVDMLKLKSEGVFQ